MASPGRGPACLTFSLFLSWYPYSGAHAIRRARLSSPDPIGTPADIKSCSQMDFQTTAAEFSLHEPDLSSAHFGAANPANRSNMQHDSAPKAAAPHRDHNRPTTLSNRDPPWLEPLFCPNPRFYHIKSRSRTDQKNSKQRHTNEPKPKKSSNPTTTTALTGLTADESDSFIMGVQRLFVANYPKARTFVISSPLIVTLSDYKTLILGTLLIITVMIRRKSSSLRDIATVFVGSVDSTWDAKKYPLCPPNKGSRMGEVHA